MFQKQIRKVQIVGIYVWRGRAFLPVQAQYESGIFVDVEPAHSAELNVSDLTKAVLAVKDAGHTQIPDPKTREEFQARKDPVMAATGARSWKQLAQEGASYTIGWTDTEVHINMSRLDKKGRWEYDPAKVQKLSPDTHVKQIVQIILEDIQSRPELIQ
jgi:hypothetical protein